MMPLSTFLTGIKGCFLSGNVQMSRFDEISSREPKTIGAVGNVLRNRRKSMAKKFVNDPALKATKQRARLVSEVARDEPKPLRAGGSVKEAGEKMRSLETNRLPVESDHRLVGALEGNHPERESGGFGHDPEMALVRGIMAKKAYYCFEHQSVDEARKIMREHHLQYLPVVDDKMRVIGMVALKDVAAVE